MILEIKPGNYESNILSFATFRILKIILKYAAKRPT